MSAGAIESSTPPSTSGVPDPQSMPSEHLEAELVAHAAWETAGLARMLRVLAEFDARRCWATWECVSAQQWLSWKCGLGYTAATERLRVARALPDLPAIAAAFGEGRLSWSKVREITRVATPDDEDRWVHIAEHATAMQVSKLAMTARRVTGQDAARQLAERQLTWRTQDDGSVVFELRVPGDQAAALRAAVEAAATPERDVPRRVSLADALVDLVLGDDHQPAQVVVHVHDDGRVHGDDGTPLAPPVAESLACDGAVTTVLETPDGPIEIDRRRAPTLRQRRVLALRHPECQFPGCHHAGRFEAHHVVEHPKGGRTRLSNLVRLCSAHHRLVHLHRLVLTLHPDRSVTVTTSDGRPVDRPISPTVFPIVDCPDPTLLGRWYGDRLDIGMCFDALGYVRNRRGVSPAGVDFQLENLAGSEPSSPVAPTW